MTAGRFFCAICPVPHKTRRAKPLHPPIPHPNYYGLESGRLACALGEGMQFVSARPLIDKFQSRRFSDAEAGPYFLALVTLETLAASLAFGEATSWMIAGAAGTVLITLFGAMHVCACNRGLGNDFFKKWFVFGWITAVRSLLVAIPFGCTVLVACALLEIRELEAVTVLSVWALTILYYAWMGRLFAQALPRETA